MKTIIHILLLMLALNFQAQSDSANKIPTLDSKKRKTIDSIQNYLAIKKIRLERECTELNIRGSEYFYYVVELYDGKEYNTCSYCLAVDNDPLKFDYIIKRNSMFRTYLHFWENSSGHTYFREDIRSGDYRPFR